MSNLPVPIPASESPGNLITGALWNANVYNGLTFALNPPVAMLYQATAQSLASSTNVTITFDSETLDSYGGHSGVTNASRYTAQVAGTYWVYGIASVSANATGARIISIYKNGSIVTGATTLSPPTASGAWGGSVGALVVMNVGDYVEINMDQQTGATLSTNVTTQCSAMHVFWKHV